ncbi:MAG: hypothetical protein VX737_01115 [Pseudomonadota bacterium]|nr:hypothetical protein [Pseudomonadota bacterium]
MGLSCCDHHIKDTAAKKSLFRRSVFILALGLLLQIHVVEHFLFLGSLAMPTFLLISAIMAYVIYSDFNHLREAHLIRKKIPLFAVFLLFFHVFMDFGYSQSLLLALLYPIFLNICLNVLKTIHDYSQGNRHFLINFRAIRDYLVDFVSLEWLPSLDIIVLFSALSTWSVSAFMLMTGMPGDLMVHDALVQIGVYNLGRWLRSHWESPDMFHNHQGSMVKIRVGDEYMDASVSSLKKGQTFRLKSKDGIIIPCHFKSVSGDCEILDTHSETRVGCKPNEKFILGTVAFSGEFYCESSYQNNATLENKAAKQIHSEKSEWGIRLFLFLLYAVGIISSGYTFMTAGIILGIEKLCLVLMVACPCVYLVIKPAIQNKIHKVSDELGIFMYTKSLPLLFSKPIIVFDRTNTLWHKDKNNDRDDAPFVISERSKKMLKSLVQQGYKVCILSGHATGDWKNHLINARKELAELGVEDVENNVIFDSKYHGENSEKWKVIKNLKHYGAMQKPSSMIKRCMTYLSSFLYPRAVWMVGDDINDVRAIKEATVATAIGRGEACAHNDLLLPYCHFVTSNTGLEQLHHLLPICVNTSYVIFYLLTFSAFISSTMMALVCGLFPLQYHFNPALFCVVTTAYCFAITVFSYSNFLDDLFMFNVEEDISLKIIFRYTLFKILDGLKSFFFKIKQEIPESKHISLKSEHLSPSSAFIDKQAPTPFNENQPESQVLASASSWFKGLTSLV